MNLGDNLQRGQFTSGSVPKFKKGDPISAAKFNKLADGVKSVVRRQGGGGGAETYRLIRGQSVGIQSGSTILLDNVWVLSGGLDPSNGNAAVQVEVANIYSQAYTDNELVNAAYSEEESGGTDVHWETLKTNTGTDQYRLISGLVKGDVTADDIAFNVDNVYPLANGLDPVSGDPDMELEIINSQFETFEDNTPITAIHDGVAWYTLIVERKRLIRGEVYAFYDGEDATFEIDHIIPLASGLDPRTDPTDVDEKIVIQNIHDDSGETDDIVVAIYNAVANQWEALPQGGDETKSYTANAASAISAGSASAPASGTGTVYEVLVGSTTSLGTKDLKNPFDHAVMGALTVNKIDDDTFLIVGYDLLQALWLLDNFGPDKILGSSDGGGPSDIEWRPTGICGAI